MRIELRITLFVVIVVTFIGCNNSHTFKSETGELTISSRGEITSLNSADGAVAFISENSPLLQVRVDTTYFSPTEADIDNNLITLHYNNGVEAVVEVEAKGSYFTFQLNRISETSQDKSVDVILWGPYTSKIDKIIGECVGVVRDSISAFGIQALNPKTLGGFPVTEDDVMPSYNIFESNDLSDIGEEDNILYRGNCAEKIEGGGSKVQAYCRDRSKARVMANWNQEQYQVPAYSDGGVIGSKIALFGTEDDMALDIISEIELAENLPHPMIDGKWAKQNIRSTSSYLIIGFGESDIEEALELTKRAGLNYLYHGGPFETWGHFKLNSKSFPDNWESLKRCVDIAKEENIDLGVHTLSNFINQNDPYVTPVPDKRLAKVGSSILKTDITDSATEIEVEDITFFKQMKGNNLKSVMVGEELIRYGRVSKQAPWKLLDCIRGAFNTKSSTHSSGDKISKLFDHGYKTFLSNMEMQNEISERLATLFNETGIKQISFDGLEGVWSTGMGQYARTLFTLNWYNHLDNKDNIINDASNPGHFFWHTYTRMNWGEPWYGGFRESQTQYRLKNQLFYRRNLMPSMLGWFSIKPETSVEDAKWLLARAAGFDAGFALATTSDITETNGSGAEILDQIKLWETARLNEVFSETQKRMMEDISVEFDLEKADNIYSLTPIYIERFVHKKKVRQPGEPLFSEFTFKNRDGVESPLEAIISCNEGSVKGIKIEMNNHETVTIPATLNKGEYIRYQGENSVDIYSSKHQLIESIDVVGPVLHVIEGENSVIVDCTFLSTEESSQINIEIRVAGEELK